MNISKQPKLNMQEAMELMKRIAKEEGLKLTFLKADEGRGGYNYGGSCGDCIMLAPFVKIGACEKIDGYSVERPCDDSIECMLISFFHELSHCKIANELCADRSTMQNEMWVSMTGIIYAETKYGLEFSDAAVKWLLNENFSYAKEGVGKVNARDIDISNIHAVCNDCARTLGFTPKDKAVGIWMDECGVCHQRKPCTDLWHDWKQVKKGAK